MGKFLIGSRFYVVAAMVLIALSISSAVILTEIHVDSTQVLSFVTTIGGFAILMMSQYRDSIRADRSNVEIKRAIHSSGHSLKSNIEIIQKINEDVRRQVSNEFSLGFETVARALKRIADLTGDPEDIEAARQAMKVVLEDRSRRIKEGGDPANLSYWGELEIGEYGPGSE